MGNIGFELPDDGDSTDKILPDDIVVPKSMFGLSPQQMLAMGIAGDQVERFQQNITEDSIRASSFYVPSAAKISADSRQPSAMRMAGGGGRARGAPRSPPPDLPSLLLDARIVYIGMPLVASVTELIISELLWLQYASAEKPVYMYINSLGSQREQQAVGFETEAYAILDTMNYIRPSVNTLVIGQAYGNACMLLAGGEKGKRATLPHARIKMAPPRINRSFGSTTDVMIKANELEQNTDSYISFMAQFTGKEQEVVAEDCARDRYFTPEKAISYGIVDKIVQAQDGVAIDAQDYKGAARAARAQRQRSSRDDEPVASA